MTHGTRAASSRRKIWAYIIPFIFAALVSAAGFIFYRIQTCRPGLDIKAGGLEESPILSEKPLSPKPAAGILPSPLRPRIAIVIDDLGFDVDLAVKTLAVPLPLTLAIMPQLPASTEISNLAIRHKRDILLHLPMEPLDYPRWDPGPGSLMNDMSSQRMENILISDLNTVPGTVGINNHMGSRFTADAGTMERFMDLLASRNMFFLDSRTAPSSLAYQTAQKRGVRSYRRDVFLDNDLESNAIRMRIHELIALAKSRGDAIGIGHPKAVTLDVLADSIDLFKSSGVEVVPISHLTP